MMFAWKNMSFTIRIAKVICAVIFLSFGDKSCVFARPAASEKHPSESNVFVSLTLPEVFPDSLLDSQAGGYFEGKYYVSEDVKINVRRQAVVNKTALWPRGLVPYVLDKIYTPANQGTIESAMREIEQSVGNSSHPCVKFIPRTTETNYLDIRNGTGCSSVIGLDNTGPQVSTFAIPCLQKGTLVHELLHTLGLYHEQDRYDRDTFVNINYTNMIDEAQRDYVLKNNTSIDTLNTPYDFSSIMHYGPYAFTKDPRYPVMTPKPEYSSGAWIGQRYALSPIDVLRVQRLYKCPEDTSHIVSDIAPQNRLVWCDFENDTCNLEVFTSLSWDGDLRISENSQDRAPSKGRNVYWTLTAKATEDGPKAGATNGLDFFFYASKRYSRGISEVSSESPHFTRNLTQQGELINNSSHFSVVPENLTDRPIVSDDESRLVTTSTNSTREINPSYSTTALSLPSTNASTPTLVHLRTAPIVTDNILSCIDFHLQQSGQSGYLEVYVDGPRIARRRLFSNPVHLSHWFTVRENLLLMPAGEEFQLEIVAVLEEGSVAIDNLHVIKGRCL